MNYQEIKIKLLELMNKHKVNFVAIVQRNFPNEFQQELMESCGRVSFPVDHRSSTYNITESVFRGESNQNELGKLFSEYETVMRFIEHGVYVGFKVGVEETGSWSESTEDPELNCQHSELYQCEPWQITVYKRIGEKL